MEFKLSFVSTVSPDRRKFIKHMPTLDELFKGPKTWFSNMRASRDGNTVTLSHVYLPVNDGRQVFRGFNLHLTVVGLTGELDLPLMSFLPASSTTIPSLNRRGNRRYRVKRSVTLIGTDHSGPDDLYDSIVRAVVREIISRNFS